jgi:protein-L-isoaspartate(D-aspartate) O-methyltransferase
VLYDDVVVALDADKRINNGQPSLHARCLSAARVKTGERSHNLEAWPQAHAALRDATASPIPRGDFIYVSAGCTHPVRAWAEALGEGGRLVMPLTPGWDFGGMLMLTRRGDRYDARFLCRCAFIPSVGASNEEERESVRDAFDRGGMHDVRELRFDDAPRESAWLAGDGWTLLT